jgi:hemolysin D
MPKPFNIQSPINPDSPPVEAQNLPEFPEGQILQAPNRTHRDRDWSNSAQELLDTLPQAWTKGLLYLLIGFTSIGLPWALFSKVEETGSARGRLEPKGKSFRLDAPVSGTVTRIHVKSGQTVKAGQILLELDAEPVRHELERAEVALRGLLGERKAQISQAQQQINASMRSYTLLQSQLAKDLIEVNRYRKLWQQGGIAQVKVAEVERVVIQSRQAVNQARSELEQAQAELKRQQGNDRSKNRNAESTGLETEILQARKQIQSLQAQLQQRIIRAPVDGTVFEMPIERPGTVVQPSQLMAQVAPKGSPLVLRAQLPSQESGFVRAGLPAKLKFEAYPFQDYGVVPGQIRWISPTSKSAESPGQPEVFEVEVDLKQTEIPSQGRQIPLTAGQTAIAEILVRERRMIDFVLDPLKKLKQDGLKL